MKKFREWLYRKLYGKALKVVEFNIKEMNDKEYYQLKYDLDRLDTLTYSNNGKDVYLCYGMDNMWKKVCPRYEVLERAIKKLYMYEKKEYYQSKEKHLNKSIIKED